MQLTEKVLEMLLKEAKAAHAKHEQETGQKDENWASWYSEYIINRLNEMQKKS